MLDALRTIERNFQKRKRIKENQTRNRHQYISPFHLIDFTPFNSLIPLSHSIDSYVIVVDGAIVFRATGTLFSWLVPAEFHMRE